MVMVRKDYPEDFEIFWRTYPRKTAKVPAYKNYSKLINKGVTFDEIIKATACAREQWLVREHRQAKYIPHPATFLGESCQWMEYLKKDEMKVVQEGFVEKVLNTLDKFYPKKIDSTKTRISLDDMFCMYDSEEDMRSAAYAIQTKLNVYLDQVDRDGTPDEYIKECHNWLRTLVL